MKKAIVGTGLMISGTIGVSSQRIIDTIFVANGWNITHSGLNLVLGVSGGAIIGGIVFAFWL